MGVIFVPDTSIIKYREMKEKFIRSRRSQRTKEEYSRSLQSYITHFRKYAPELHPFWSTYRDVRDIIEDWVFTMTTKVTPTSARAYLAAVSSFYSFLIKEEFVDLVKNPARGIDIWDDGPPRDMQFPDAELADRFERCLAADAESGTLVDMRSWLLYRFLTEGGFRASELCNIQLKDVETETGRVRIVNGKGGRSRTTIVLVETGRMLAEFANTYHLEEEDYIFMSSNMYAWETKRKRSKDKGVKPISRCLLADMLKTRAREHKFTDKEVDKLKRPHGYRHLWAVRQVDAGTHYSSIMLMGGWRSMTMLLRYIQHASPGLVAIERNT
jgi:integrase